MPAGPRLTVALAAATLSFVTALAGVVPAGAATGAHTGTERRPDAAMDVRGTAVTAPPVAAARMAARPLFAFWGKKYNRIDGFGFATAKRGSGTPVEVAAAWKTYRGVKPLLPKVFVQARVDGGSWRKVSGTPGKIGRLLVSATVPAYVVPAGVPVQTVDYRFKTKKPKKGPRRARRSVTSDPVSVTYDNQAMYTGDQLRYYAPIATLCPNARVEIDTTNITEEHDGLFSWQYGVTIDAAALAAQNNTDEVNSAIAVHECAHMKQFYNWGGTNKSWGTLVARSAEVFAADNNPDPAVVTPPMQPGWAPLEHAADCATLAVYPNNQRTYGGYCNPSELAAAALLWQNQTY